MDPKLANATFRILINIAIILGVYGIFSRSRINRDFYSSIFSNKTRENSSNEADKRAARRGCLSMVLCIVILILAFIFHYIFLK